MDILSCFHLLANMDNADYEHMISIWVPALNSFGYDQKNVLLNRKIILYLTFWGPTKLFYTVVYNFILSPAM